MLGKMFDERSLPVIHLLVAAWQAVSELDTRRAANLLIRQHGPDDELEAAKRTDLMLDRGDDDGRYGSGGRSRCCGLRDVVG
jgi:hypothetical protein